MGQEFIIKSKDLEDKINQLLPSQGGLGSGVDLSASTQIIPIIDLTESAEGSTIRQDLQTAMSVGSITAFEVSNTTSTLINTTGYFRVLGTINIYASTAGGSAQFSVTDGLTTKVVTGVRLPSAPSGTGVVMYPFDFIVFTQAGDSLTATSSASTSIISGSTRQIADISGNLVNPT